MSRYVFDIVLEGSTWHIGEGSHSDPITALDAALTVLEAAGYLWQTEEDGYGADLPEASHVSVCAEHDQGSADYTCWYWFGSPVLCAADSSLDDIQV